jgi:hypothetical protein
MRLREGKSVFNLIKSCLLRTSMEPRLEKDGVDFLATDFLTFNKIP